MGVKPHTNRMVSPARSEVPVPSHGSGVAGHFQGLSSSDPRVRRIPFATQRPTFSESRRVVGLLVSVFEPSAGFLAAEQGESTKSSGFPFISLGDTTPSIPT
eukprot:1037689-Pelagomonas_calceolata.AAC.1